MKVDDLQQFWDRGWEVIPVQRGTKQPAKGLSRWPDFRHEDHTREELADLFEGHGVALLLGPSSNNVVDVDLDSVEARRWSTYILDAHTLKIGRPGNPNSHFLYVSEVLANQKSRSFHDPFIFATTGKRKPLLELRTRGHYQLIPPTEHPDVDAPYQWGDDRLVTPVEIDAEDLSYKVSLIAVLSMLARYWDRWEGSRHDLWMHVCGGLLRSNPSFWSGEHQLEAVSDLFATVTGYHDTAMLVGAARTTLGRFNHGAAFTGWGSMYEILKGEWSGVVDACREWLPPVADEPEEEEYEEEEYEDSTFGVWSARAVDMAALLDAGVPEPASVYPGFLWERMEHVVVGEAGVGKTLLTCHIVQTLAQEGRHSIWLDYQNGRNDIARRFQTMGLTREEMALITVIEFPDVPMSRGAAFRDLMAMIDHYDTALVIVDSMMDLLAQERSEMNSGDDYNALHSAVLKPLRERVAIMTHEHTAKHDPSTPIGSIMKKNQTQVQWNLTNPERMTPNRTDQGGIVATCKKPRGAPISKGSKVGWLTVPHGEVRLTDTGQPYRAEMRVELAGHASPGDPSPIMTPGVQGSGSTSNLI